MTKILVVDDEQHIIELVTLYLEHEGYQVTGVGTGEAARAQLKAGGFDLVVLDLIITTPISSPSKYSGPDR